MHVTFDVYVLVCFSANIITYCIGSGDMYHDDKKNKMVLKSIEFIDYLSVRLHITCPNSCWKPHFGQ